MSKKDAYAPRNVVASAEGDVIHIRCKQTGRVILKLKLVPDKKYKGDYELLMSMCDNDNGTSYSWDDLANEQIANYEAMGVKP